MDKKYELTDESINYYGRTLYRIRSCKDFMLLNGDIVHKGDLGGYIEQEDNLSQGGTAWMYGNAKVWGNARVYGDACVCDNAWVYGNAIVCKVSDVLTVGLVGSRDDYTTFYRTKNNQIWVCCGCFNGSIDDFLAAVAETHGDNKHAKVYRAAAELARLQIDFGGA